MARLGGWFARNLDPDLTAALDRIGAALGGVPTVELPEVARARSAAYVMTAAEGGARHLAELRRDAMGFDPATRGRLIAGAMAPASTYLLAQRFRAWFADAAAQVFARHDVLLAPATGTVAPRIDDPTMVVDGARVPARAHLGLFTQPLSFIGLPVLAVPLRRDGALPLGLQLIAAPGGEAKCFALARRLVALGVIDAVAAPAAQPAFPQVSEF